MNNAPQVVASSQCVSNATANPTDSLPIIRNANAVKFGFRTKLVPIYLDGVQVGWSEEHEHSKISEVRRDSPEALRAAGMRVPFVDYEPIAEDENRRSANARFMPHWTGD